MYKILLLIIFLMPLSAVADDPCVKKKYTPFAKRYEKGLLFRISKCGYEDSYILGTMHSDLPQVQNAIPQRTFSIISASNSANFELKKDSAMQAQLITAMFYPRDSVQNLRMVIGEEIYADLKKVLTEKRKDLQEAMYFKMRPWAVALLMQVPPDSNDGKHLDAKLESFAEYKGVEVFGLETVDEQLSVFTDLPTEDQIEFLQEAIDNLGVIQEMNHKLLSRYLEADLAGLQELANDSFEMMKDADLKARLESRLIIERNKLMMQRMQPKLAEGAAFVAVGALHLPGENGLLQMLEQRGFHIHVVND